MLSTTRKLATVLVVFCLAAGPSIVLSAPTCGKPSVLSQSPCNDCTKGNSVQSIKDNGGGCVWCYDAKFEDRCQPYVLPSSISGIFDAPAPCGWADDKKTEPKPFTFGGPNCDCAPFNDCGNCTKNPVCTWVKSSKVVTNFTWSTAITKETTSQSFMWLNNTCMSGNPLGPIYQDEAHLFSMDSAILKINIISYLEPIEWFYLQCFLAGNLFLYFCLGAFAVSILTCCCVISSCRKRFRKGDDRYGYKAGGGKNPYRGHGNGQLYLDNGQHVNHHYTRH